MDIDGKDLETLVGVVERNGLDAIVLRAGDRELVIRPRPTATPEIALERALTYRWSDGDWIVETHLALTNRGAQTLVFTPACIAVVGHFAAWPPVTTLGLLPIGPGETKRGVLGWYCSSAAPQPQEIGLFWTPDRGRTAGWTGSSRVTLDESRSPAAVAGAALAACEIELTDPVVFRWPDDDWIVRVHARVQNGSSAAVRFERSSATATILRPFQGAMAGWDPAATMPDVVSIPPGEAAEGQLAWYCSGTLAQPTQVRIVIGAPGAPRLTRDIDPVLGQH